MRDITQNGRVGKSKVMFPKTSNNEIAKCLESIFE